MVRTAVVIDAHYLRHDPGPGHPEAPARIGALIELLDGGVRPELVRLRPRAATPEELAYIHEPAYVARVAATAGRDHAYFDADTTASADSYETARLAAGGFLVLLDAVIAGEVANGFALVRPPGHHAERDRAMGFCFFNNVAIGAEYLRRRYHLERIAIIDWDLHHGNGTQHAFFSDPGVLYVSIHQYPHYPGTGAAHEIGAGAGRGFTLNIPLPAGAGDDEYRRAFLELVEPVCRRFAPQFVLVSAGFDAHRRDPLGGMELSEDGFGALARICLRAARRSAAGRFAAILEGGYDLSALRASAARVLEEMGEEKLDQPLPPGAGAEAALARVRAAHAETWGL